MMKDASGWRGIVSLRPYMARMHFMAIFPWSYSGVLAGEKLVLNNESFSFSADV